MIDPNVRKILTKYLEDMGWDGLFNADGGCACDIAELIPCGQDCSECQPGYKHPCDCEEEHEFHISAEKMVDFYNSEKGQDDGKG